MFRSLMNNFFFAFFVAAATVSLPALAQNSTPQKLSGKSGVATSQHAVFINGKRIAISAGTPIKLQTTEKIYAKKLAVNTPVEFTVAEDVKIGDTSVFEKDAPAKGVVTYAKGAQNWNKSSKWEFNVLWGTAADGRQIPTMTHFKETARRPAWTHQAWSFPPPQA